MRKRCRVRLLLGSDQRVVQNRSTDPASDANPSLRPFKMPSLTNRPVVWRPLLNEKSLPWLTLDRLVGLRVKAVRARIPARHDDGLKATKTPIRALRVIVSRGTINSKTTRRQANCRPRRHCCHEPSGQQPVRQNSGRRREAEW